MNFFLSRGALAFSAATCVLLLMGAILTELTLNVFMKKIVPSTSFFLFEFAGLALTVGAISELTFQLEGVNVRDALASHSVCIFLTGVGVCYSVLFLIFLIPFL